MREPTKEEREQDIEFLVHIIFEIRDYANSAGQEPDETLKAIAEWILEMLKISTFNDKLERVQHERIRNNLSRNHR